MTNSLDDVGVEQVLLRIATVLGHIIDDQLLQLLHDWIAILVR